MTLDQIKVVVNDLKSEMEKVELRLDRAGYRGLARTIYDARLRLSCELAHVCAWPPLALHEDRTRAQRIADGDEPCPRCNAECVEPGFAICRSCSEREARTVR